MTITINISENEIQKDKTIEEMVMELYEKGLISSSAMYLMTERK